MQIVGLTIMLTTASSNISSSIQQWLKVEDDVGINIIKEVMQFLNGFCFYYRDYF